MTWELVVWLSFALSMGFVAGHWRGASARRHRGE
jgi:hypothetical protein